MPTDARSQVSFRTFLALIALIVLATSTVTQCTPRKPAWTPQPCIPTKGSL